MANKKADTGKRIIAAIVDALIAFIVVVIIMATLGWIPGIGGLFRFLASLLAVAYMGFRDAIPISDLDGASPGKKILGLKAVNADGSNCDYEASFKRNLPFVIPGVLSLFSIIPLLGWLIAILGAFVALVIYAVELYKVITDPLGKRIGDMFADTLVIETASSASAGPGATPGPPPPAPPQGPTTGSTPKIRRRLPRKPKTTSKSHDVPTSWSPLPSVARSQCGPVCLGRGQCLDRGRG